MGAASPEDAPAGPSPAGLGPRLHDGGTREAGGGRVRRLSLAGDLLVAGRRRSVPVGDRGGPASIQPSWRSRSRPAPPSANHQSLSDRRAPAGRGAADGGGHLFSDPGARRGPTYAAAALRGPMLSADPRAPRRDAHRGRTNVRPSWRRARTRAALTARQRIRRLGGALAAGRRDALSDAGPRHERGPCPSHSRRRPGLEHGDRRRLGGGRGARPAQGPLATAAPVTGAPFSDKSMMFA